VQAQVCSKSAFVGWRCKQNIICRLELPSYMVPRHLAIFEDFPKLSSGKADRKALASILTVRMTKEAEEEMTAHEH
jgi:acyl-coenzyme A synthetase/AMP-(fatty) acid ligase